MLLRRRSERHIPAGAAMDQQREQRAVELFQAALRLETAKRAERCGVAALSQGAL